MCDVPSRAAGPGPGSGTGPWPSVSDDLIFFIVRGSCLDFLNLSWRMKTGFKSRLGQAFKSWQVQESLLGQGVPVWSLRVLPQHLVFVLPSFPKQNTHGAWFPPSSLVHWEH